MATRVRIDRKRFEPRSKWVVYRLYDKDDGLVYVGQTNNFFRRMDDHARVGRAWWDLVAYAELEECGSRRAALIREAEVIKSEEPRANVQFTNGMTGGRRRGRPLEWDREIAS